MNQTENYSLNKPEYTDNVDIAKLNENADIIDAKLKEHSDALELAALGIKYRGAVDYYADLPLDAEIGDAYTVKYSGDSGTTPDGTEYVWGNVGGSEQWIDFSKDSYTKAEVDALLAGLQTILSATNKLNPAYINYDSTHRAVSDTEKSTWNDKQNALTTAQLAAVNSGIDSTKVAQITTNKNNILLSLDANGAKNQLDYTLESLKAINSRGTWVDNVYTVNNVKYTVNSDMSITAETIGTPSGNTILALKSNVANSYVGAILSGCPTGGNNATYNIAIEQSTSPYTLLAQDAGLSATIPNYTSRNIIIYVVVKTTLSEPIVFEPMICSADLWAISHQYQPYALSNAELTAAIQALQAQLSNQ